MKKSTDIDCNNIISEDVQKICRLCFENQETELNRLFSPCDCKGTMKHIHQNCLKEWRSKGIEAFNSCRTCEYKYHFRGEYYISFLNFYILGIITLFFAVLIVVLLVAIQIKLLEILYIILWYDEWVPISFFDFSWELSIYCIAIIMGIFVIKVAISLDTFSNSSLSNLSFESLITYSILILFLSYIPLTFYLGIALIVFINQIDKQISIYYHNLVMYLGQNVLEKIEIKKT